jgi:hypothetical protein
MVYRQVCWCCWLLLLCPTWSLASGAQLAVPKAVYEPVPEPVHRQGLGESPAYHPLPGSTHTGTPAPALCDA